ncbi:MAG: S49 family peptidase, partial [Chitinophagales bacterium]
ATGRGMQVEAVNEIAQGRVWTGEDALDIGLVDRLGDLNDAIAVAAGMANLEEGDYRLKSYPQQKDPVQKILEDLMGNVRQDAVEAELGAYYQHYKQLKGLSEMQGVQALMPYEMDIK